MFYLEILHYDFTAHTSLVKAQHPVPWHPSHCICFPLSPKCFLFSCKGQPLGKLAVTAILTFAFLVQASLMCSEIPRSGAPHPLLLLYLTSFKRPASSSVQQLTGFHAPNSSSIHFCSHIRNQPILPSLPSARMTGLVGIITNTPDNCI